MLLSIFVNKIHKYDILDYNINLSFKPESNLAKINCAIRINVVEKGQQRISFFITPHIKNLKNITCDKKNIKKYYIKSFLYFFKQIIIIFDKQLIKNEILSFTMDYEVEYTGKGRLYGIVKQDYIELVPDSMFYPFIFNDLFKFSLIVNSDKDYHFVSNAELEKFIPKNLKNTFHFVSTKNTQAIFLIGGKYKILEKKRDNLITQIWTLRNKSVLYNNKNLLDLLFKHLFKILNFYKNMLGEENLPYRFILVEREENKNESDYIWYGTENFIAVSSAKIRKLHNKYTDKELERQLIIYLAHEIAHRYFGNILFVKDYLPGGVWLKEGFAQYFTFLYLESLYNKEEVNKIFWLDIGNEYLKTLSKKRKFLPLSNSTYLDIPDMEIAYTRGAWILHTLRYIVGDKTFFKIIKEYIKNYGGNFVTLKDFENTVKNNYGGEIQWFFNEWLYTNYNVDYSIRNVMVNKVNNNYLLKFEIENLDKLTVKTPIEVLIKSQNEEKIIKLIFKKERNNFIIPIKTELKKIIIDPNYWILDINRENNIFIIN